MSSATVEAARPKRRWFGALIRYSVLLLIGLYPVMVAWGAFAGIEPLDQWAVWRALAGAWLVTFIFYGLARLVIRDPDARTLWLGVVLLVCSFYGFLGVNGLHLVGPSRWIAFLYFVGAVVGATLVVRPWRRIRLDLVPLLLVATALIGVNAYSGVARLWANPASRWQPAADELVAAATGGPQRIPANGRDIYYIVLDGFGRADTLKTLYDLDLQNFVGFLEARGFYVPAEARSNYAHTLLSFSSFLNLGYLDLLGTVMGKESESWLPLADLIQRNALMRLAKRAGYQVVGIGSDYGPTKRFNEADICFCEQRGLDMFEHVVIDETVFTALAPDSWTYGAHRRKVLDAFSTLEHLPSASSPRFVFAHILAPHPPFTFGADGSPRRPKRSFMFNEGSDFLGSHEEYVRGYRDQTEFMTRRLHDVIESILNRPGPRPVIIVHGDHGPGSMLELNDASRTNLPERMDILAAYYFPDGQGRLYPSMTPVNGARALANDYLGTDLPQLPDKSWFSTARHPFDFTLVPNGPIVRAQ